MLELIDNSDCALKNAHELFWWILDQRIKKTFLIACVPDIQENYCNIKQIWILLKLNELERNFYLVSDLKVSNIMIGIMAHGSAYPCCWCDMFFVFEYNIVLHIIKGVFLSQGSQYFLFSLIEKSVKFWYRIHQNNELTGIFQWAIRFIDQVNQSIKSIISFFSKCPQWKMFLFISLKRAWNSDTESIKIIHGHFLMRNQNYRSVQAIDEINYIDYFKNPSMKYFRFDLIEKSIKFWSRIYQNNWWAFF